MPTLPHRPSILVAIACCLFTIPANAQHSLVTQGNGKLSIVNKQGDVDWEMKWGGIHDIHVLESGN
ncbi:MAG: hypothetical protein GY880_08230, partial [Planctomycetaceae bacterium]|nr:hypothetical protein [Planctomycetaceae bacterium]